MTWTKEDMLMDQSLLGIERWLLVDLESELWSYLFYSAMKILTFPFSYETEVWGLENGSNKVINPTLYDYSFGIGLYAVDFNFCSNCLSNLESC